MNKVKRDILILRVLLIIFVLLLIAITVYVIINKDRELSPENMDENEINEKNKMYRLITDYTAVGTEEYFKIYDIQEIEYEGVTYTKIGLEFDNHESVVAPFNQYFFILTDENKEKIENCYTAAYGNEEFDDIFPEYAEPSSITKGYIYCKSKRENAKYLEMKYIITTYIENIDNLDNELEIKEYFYELEANE